MSSREKWLDIMKKIALPVLDGLANERLNETFPKDFHENRADFRCLEAFGRTMCGIAPWLELNDVQGEEAVFQGKMRTLAREAIENATNPSSKDFMNFCEGQQPLVDTAFLAHAIIRAPEELYFKLDENVKINLKNALKSSRILQTYENNWVLFGAMVEAALYIMGEETDKKRIEHALDRFNEKWYLGDGTYSDGIHFAADYYNSFVIHPMYIDILRTFPQYKELLPEAIKRASRYASIQERMIAPDGTYTVIGRSSCYRFGAFQLLSQSVLQDFLPENIKPEQVRSALTAVIEKCIEGGMFDEDGWLKPGVYGYQPELAEEYINTGSLYLCSNVFLVLGLSENHPFWQGGDAPWTSKKIWSGQRVKSDHSVN